MKVELVVHKIQVSNSLLQVYPFDEEKEHLIVKEGEVLVDEVDQKKNELLTVSYHFTQGK